jgi:Uma2 family endonuclease
MTIANGVTSLADQQHIVLEDVSWESYERLLDEVGNRQIRMTYDQGRLEIMSPLAKHERWGAWIGRLIELMCFERSIDVECLGSTTFRSQTRRKGLEPDECYYFKRAAEAREIEGAFDPVIHPVPELAIEIDITSRSIPRQPIYAALGIPEIWRFDGVELQVLHLGARQKYVARARSLSLPFLPVREFAAFVLRKGEKDQLRVLREFRDWSMRLPK